MTTSIEWPIPSIFHERFRQASDDQDNLRLTKEAVTQLLVSVRSPEEAKIVARFPVAILDVKEPDDGPLGAPKPSTLREILRVVPAELTTSFAIGELRQWQTRDRQADGNEFIRQYGKLLHGFRFVKIGLAGMQRHEDWKHDWRSLFHELPIGTSPVVVAYLDHRNCGAPDPDGLVEFAMAQPHCTTILFDTYDKSGNLFAHVTPSELATLVNKAQAAGLSAVVAGSVDLSCLPDVLASHPDFIGVRGAVCSGSRMTQIDGQLVNELVSTLQAPT